MDADPWWAWLLPLAFGAPWIAAIIWSWRMLPRDRVVPPSLGEVARNRLRQR